MKRLLILLGLLFLSSLVTAAPPVTTVQQFSEGYIIEDTPQTYIRQNYNFSYNFFLFNSSNGVLINNNTVNCLFYLTDAYGEVLFIQAPQHYTSYNYWGLVIDGGNFSKVGEYNYGIKCNSSTRGGANVGVFYVTGNGKENANQSIIIFFIIMFLIIIGSLTYLVLYTLGHFVTMDFDILDFGFNLSMFFVLLSVYMFSVDYMGDPNITSFLETIIDIGGITNVFLPAVAFVVSTVVRSLTKKKFDVGRFSR
jgi:hypothetical protein